MANNRISFVFVFICLIGFDFVLTQANNFQCNVLPGQADTLTKLQQIRTQLTAFNLTAYIIVSEDEHQSEYVQLYDERRAWISGFTGSAGTAVVTTDKAALWTDGRYWTQAEGQLDCKNWLLMRSGQSGVPGISGWLASEVGNRSLPARVGVAAQFVSSNWWSSVSSTLNAANATLVEVSELVDQIWKVPERPAAVMNQVKVHPITYAGQTWIDKVDVIKKLITNRQADAYLVTALDEVAWLFNLRGSDIPYNPFFKAYAMVYANGSAELWMNETQLQQEAKVQLNSVKINQYGTFLSDLNKLADSGSINKIWISPDASQAIFSRIPSGKLLVGSSPVEATKAIKNPVEQKGFYDCGVRDGVARVKHLVWLEQQLEQNRTIDEVESATQLEHFQKDQSLFEMLSFDSISAFGPNGAIIHYSPQVETAAKITRNGIYLLDAGAQYLDCTTDVTRTHVFGVATEEEKTAYTLVLQGSIDLADAIFPVGTYSRQIDILARKSLYKQYKDYNHGTGHGIGHYLSVHEGPASISMGYSANSPPLTPGMVFSDEPGYYLPGKFGIRLETDIIVQNYKLPVNYVNTTTEFLHFDVVSWVPFERDLIICSMLTENQKHWLNTYHQDVRTKLEQTGHLNNAELDYLRRKTDPITC